MIEKKEEIPESESLRDVTGRVIPYYSENIKPDLLKNMTVLVCAHGSVIRNFVKYFDNISDLDIEEVDIPTGIPLVYRLDDHLKPLWHHYLGTDEEVKAAQQAIKDQGKRNWSKL